MCMLCEHATWSIWKLTPLTKVCCATSSHSPSSLPSAAKAFCCSDAWRSVPRTAACKNSLTSSSKVPVTRMINYEIIAHQLRIFLPGKSFNYVPITKFI